METQTLERKSATKVVNDDFSDCDFSLTKEEERKVGEGFRMLAAKTWDEVSNKWLEAWLKMPTIK